MRSMQRGLVFFGLLGLAVAGTRPAQADLIWDYSPATTGAPVVNNNFANQAAGQNFAERVSFASDVSVTGMDIYMVTSEGAVGNSATIRLWSNSGAHPGTLLSSFTETVSAVDSVGAVAGNHRVHVDFTSPLSLTGSILYWIGMSGTTATWTQTGLSGVNDSFMAQFEDTTFFQIAPSTGDMAFRLEGAVVPEPSSCALAASGLMGLAMWSRRRRKR